MRQPLFIISSGRSFSSVVCSSLGMHPDAIGLPEVNLFLFKKVSRLNDYVQKTRKGALTGLKRSVAHLMFGEQTEQTVDQATEWINERLNMSGAQMFRELIELADGRLVMDKSPTNQRNNNLDRILRGFGEANFLHLTRHPMATSRSAHKSRSSKYPDLPPRSMPEGWQEQQEKIMRFGSALPVGQFMTIQGEWFLEDPVAVITQICEWLNLEPSPQAIEQMLKTEESPFAFHGPDNARLGNNKGFIENPKLRIGRPKSESLYSVQDWVEDEERFLTPELQNLAHRLGYDH